MTNNMPKFTTVQVSIERRRQLEILRVLEIQKYGGVLLLRDVIDQALEAGIVVLNKEIAS